MFTVTKKLLVDGVYYFPERKYSGKPNRISPRYLASVDTVANKPSNENKPTKKRRRRARVSNSAITNQDKE